MLWKRKCSRPKFRLHVTNLLCGEQQKMGFTQSSRRQMSSLSKWNAFSMATWELPSFNRSLQTDGCSEPGCFIDEFKYNATLDQLEQLTSISAECKQEIFHNCTMNKLTGFSWWTDRYGKEREYWHGSYGDGTVGCYCSLEGDGCEDEHFDVSLYLQCGRDFQVTFFREQKCGKV